MRAAERIGGDAPNIGVYLKKGNTPRGHDHRSVWAEMFDAATSNVGTCETGGIVVQDVVSVDEVSTAVARAKGARFFKDSLVICLLATDTYRTITHAEDPALKNLIELLNAVTGWDFSRSEVDSMGFRVANLLRVFNLKQGITSAVERPSPRYGSAPEEGFAKGKSILTNWKQMVGNYYRHMGWDQATGIPLPETLKQYGLEHIIDDMEKAKTKYRL